MVKKTLILPAIGLNIVFMAIYLIFGQLQFGSLDDYFMSGILTGAYGSTYDVHMYFVNSAYGYFLKPFYWLFPKVGWYFIFELLGTFSAFTVFTYFLIHRTGLIWGAALSALLLASLTPDFYFQLSFTQCATIYTAAGLLLAYFGIEAQKLRFLALSVAFLLAGSIMRHEGFLLGMPYLILLLLPLLRVQRQFAIKAVIAAVLVVASIFIIREHDSSLFTEGDYKYYAQYQGPRSFLGDGAFYDKEATFDELEERGMSGPDFYLLKAWMYYDTEVFHRDSLLPIIDVAKNNLYEPNPRRVPVAFFTAVSSALTKGCGWCWALLCFLLLLSKSKKGAVYPWLSLGIVALSIGYLLMVNRVASHVVTGIWLYAIVFAIPFQGDYIFDFKQRPSKQVGILWLGILVLSGIIGVSEVQNQRLSKIDYAITNNCVKGDDWGKFVQYAKDNPDKVFILSFTRYKELGVLRNPAYLSVEPGAFDNIFSWGYWNIHLPAMKAELAKRGVKNPVRDIIHDNVYLIEDLNKPTLVDFYKDHYHKALRADTVKEFGDLMLLKYRLANDNSRADHE